MKKEKKKKKKKKKKKQKLKKVFYFFPFSQVQGYGKEDNHDSKGSEQRQIRGEGGLTQIRHQETELWSEIVKIASVLVLCFKPSLRGHSHGVLYDKEKNS